MENVGLTVNVLIANHVLKTFAKILAKHHSTLVENKLSAEQSIIVLYASAHQNGLVIHMFNAFNVSWSYFGVLCSFYQFQKSL